MAVRPDMSRNESLAGQSVKKGNYTITYNDRGYATKAVKDNGKSATSTVKTTHANDSATHQAMYEAAQSGDWDKVGSLSHGLIGANGDFSAGNQYMQELQDEFKYDDNEYYGKKYDAVYGQGAWDGGTGTGKPTYNDYSDKLVQAYKQNAQQYGEGTDAAAAAQQAMAQQLAAQQVAVRNQANLQELGMMTGGTSAGGYSDMMKYLEDMYAQNLEAELSALKSAYDANVAELESQNDAIAEQYRAARNQEARQNELQRMRMNEFALAQGLNTGTSGQMALAQNMAYQGNLGNLWAQEAQTQAEVDMALAQLLNQYNSNVQQTTANINAKRNAALYEEAVRQQELARDQQKSRREDVLTLIAGGVMPAESMLAAAGMDQTEVLLWQALANGGAAPVTQTASNPVAGSPVPGYNNGGLTRDQVWLMQNLLGVNADGLWGNQSSTAAGGKTADQAWADLSGQISGNYAGVQDALSRVESSGRNVNVRAAAVIQDAYESGKITENQAKALLAQYGL